MRFEITLTIQIEFGNNGPLCTSSALCCEFQSDKELSGMAKKPVVNYNKEHLN